MESYTLDLTRLPMPDRLYASPHQSGITDPLWPLDGPGPQKLAAVREEIKEREAEGRIEDVDDADLTDEALLARYAGEYAGRVSRPKVMSVMRANVLARDRAEFIQVLKLLSEFAVEMIEKRPSVRHAKLLEEFPDSYRVTVTLGFGASLFVDQGGFDRYGLRGQKPKFLKPMPSFTGDAEGFDPDAAATDLIILFSSDHPYVNVANVRYVAEFFNKRFSERHHAPGQAHPVLEFGTVEEGFSRKDKREFLGFDDGIDNIHMGPDDLKRLVYVNETDTEPDWCVNGSYMVYRKIRENMPTWESLTVEDQEGMIGRDKDTSRPLSRQVEGPDQLTPVYPDPLNPADGPLSSHIRKVQPRRPQADLFGIDDKERRFLRRPYPFFDGLDDQGRSINGLQFIAFMKSIQQQFEHVVNMWQLNPDFPEPGTGIDALFANNILSTIDGGYYFCPPGLTGPDDFFGSGMFAS